MVHAVAAVAHYVDVSATNPVFPFASWATAATNIQDAVDAASTGDEVIVTNGIYGCGGRAVVGTMTNRVVVDKALTLRSVNGPQYTIIQGYQVTGTTNGDGAIRCVYLTNGAAMVGFTLNNGATRVVPHQFNYYPEQSGGGVYCESADTVVSNCLLVGNSALYGGGAYAGTLEACLVAANTADGVSHGGMCYGGGAYQSTLRSCTLTGNSTSGHGGGVYGGRLNNCTVTGNSAQYGGGVINGTLANCIVYFNLAAQKWPDSFNSVFNYCCTPPLATNNGVGNIFVDPQLTSASHISAASHCRGKGSAAYIMGTDIDGEPWANPPSIGCDEYLAGAVTGPLEVSWSANRLLVTPGYTVTLTPAIQGKVSLIVWDFGDGVVISNRPYASYTWTKPGDYSVVLRAYNGSHPDGVSATGLVQVAIHPTLYVAAGNTNAVYPYLSWAKAAPNIQDAVDAAVEVAVPGSLVVVSNGVYATGGRNGSRVKVSGPFLLQSVNGPEFTLIDGAGMSACADLTSGSGLSHFTLTNGSSGVVCDPTGVVSNCVMTGNSVCGAAGGTLYNCALAGNSGVGASGSSLYNSTLTDNAGGGASGCVLNNCIVYFNTARGGLNYDFSCSLNYCCTTPLPGGLGNIDLDPQLASTIHLSVISPCRGAGSADYARGTDIDGESWSNPPSMGCDEYYVGMMTGPLNAGIRLNHSDMTVGYPVEFAAVIQGRTTLSVWEFGDGTVVPNQPYTTHSWTVPGDYIVVLSAYNETIPGVATASIIVHVLPPPIHFVSLDSTNPQPPFVSWATAATNIQDAVDAVTLPGATVVVTNGTYATGGRAVGTNLLTNRVAVDKPLVLQSVNGPEFTVIQGLTPPGYTTNRAPGVRCVYLGSGAGLSGFTLTNGDTRDAGSVEEAKLDSSGGGVWCEAATVVVSNCVLGGNSARWFGGGAYLGTLIDCELLITQPTSKAEEPTGQRSRTAD
jgi:PKD repeat protein